MEETRKGLNDPYQKAMLKGAILQVKLLHNIRTNIVVVMKHMGIKLVEPKKQEEIQD